MNNDAFSPDAVTPQNINDVVRLPEDPEYLPISSGSDMETSDRDHAVSSSLSLDDRETDRLYQGIKFGAIRMDSELKLNKLIVSKDENIMVESRMLSPNTLSTPVVHNESDQAAHSPLFDPVDTVTPKIRPTHLIEKTKGGTERFSKFVRSSLEPWGEKKLVS
eukprot:UN31018